MNNELKIGVRVDTGRKWIDSDGIGHIIYRKALAISVALPNNSNIDVAHGEPTINRSRPVMCTGITGVNAGVTTRLAHAPLTVTQDVTNINIATTLNLSTYTSGMIEIEFCLYERYDATTTTTSTTTTTP